MQRTVLQLLFSLGRLGCVVAHTGIAVCRDLLFDGLPPGGVEDPQLYL